MNIHEFQGKQLFAKYGLAVPKGVECKSVDDAVRAYESLDSELCVVKAQIHAGGRGKGGGVKLVKSADEAREAAEAILGMNPRHAPDRAPRASSCGKVWVEEGSRHRQGVLLRDRDRPRAAAARS